MYSLYSLVKGNIRIISLFVILLSITSSSLAVSVGIKVNMTNQINDGSFNPAFDKVYIRGSFNSWAASNEMTSTGNGLYTANLDLESYTPYEFKFYTDAPGFPNSGWETSVGINSDNRSIYTGTTNMDVGSVYFNNSNLKLRTSKELYEIYCSDIDVEYIESYVEYVDSLIPRLSNTFKTTLGSKVRIWIYPDRKSFMLAYGNPWGYDWIIGYANGRNDLVLVSPKTRGGDKDAGLIGHEFTHIFVHWKTKTDVPIWLNEGAACYFAGEPGEESFNLRFNGEIQYCIDNYFGGNLPELSKVEGSDFAEFGGYSIGASTADFIFNTKGSDAFVALFENMDYSVIGYNSKAEFQTAWHNFLREEYLVPHVNLNFKVDLRKYESLGLFNPATDKVYIGGDFCSWYPYLMKKTGNGIYSFSFPAKKNTEYHYKFKINTQGAANDGWESLEIGDRTITTSGADIIIPIVGFNSTDSQILTVKFSVDMNYQISKGVFNKKTDKVYLKGSFNGWGDQNPMEDEDGDGIYTCTLILDPATKYEYKYFINSAGAENSGWESNTGNGENGNRTITTEDSSIVLPIFTFNSIISNNSTITLLSPNGGESWKVGSKQNITWDYKEVNNVKIEYTTDLGETWKTIISSVAASNKSYSFTVPNEVAYEWKIRISDASVITNSDITDGLFITYNELPASVSPLMNIEYPVFTWPLNAYYPDTKPEDSQITNGKVGNACGPTVVANLLRYWEFPIKGSGSRTFTDHLNCFWSANFGETIYEWDEMPRYVMQNASKDEYDAVATMMYHAGVAMHNIYRSGAREGVVDAFHNYFNYNKKSKFLYRNDYTPEQWDKIFKSEFAQKRPIIIGGDGGPLPEGGVAGHWFICDGYNSSNKYHIRWDYGEKNDEYLPLYEFKPFHVNNWAMVYLEPDLQGKELTLLSPVGNENWQQGSKQEIKWNSKGIENVKIEYSRNNGSDYITLVSSVSAAPGSYNITLPSGVSKDCKIRISDAGNINVYSRNTTNFSVYDNKELSILKCFPGNLQPGTVFPIRWNSKGINNLTIEYSVNNGSGWIVISDAIAATQVFNWEVPDVSSTDCLIKLSDKNDKTLYSTSEKYSISNVQYPGGPYAVDENTVLLLHFNENYENEAKPDKNGIINQMVSFEENYELGLDHSILVENPNESVYSNVEIPFYSNLFLKNDWTVELWFRINSWGTGTVTYPTLVTLRGMNYTIEPDPVARTIKAGYSHSAGGELISLPNNSVDENKWYHVAFIRDAVKKKLILQLRDESRNLISSENITYSTTNTPKSSSEALLIGGYHVIGKSQFDGNIDELRISNIVRDFSDQKEDTTRILTVKFSVDMNYQISNGIFNKKTDKVYLKGSFNGWGDQNPMSDENGDGIYTCTLILDPVTKYEYKYFINSAGAENSGWELAVGNGDSGNRLVVTQNSPIELNVDYFNNKSVSANFLEDKISFSNYPNPVRGISNFNFSIPSKLNVKITIYDLPGKEVSEVINDDFTPGTYSIKWDASCLKSGIYFYRIKAGDLVETKRLVIITQ